MKGVWGLNSSIGFRTSICIGKEVNFHECSIWFDTEIVRRRKLTEDKIKNETCKDMGLLWVSSTPQ